MSKVITSPVGRFPGTVTIPDYLTYPQALAWEQAVNAAQELRDKPDTSLTAYQAAWLPGVLACVDEWHIDGVTSDHFPATPRKAATELLSWLIGEIANLYTDAESVPNG